MINGYCWESEDTIERLKGMEDGEKKCLEAIKQCEEALDNSTYHIEKEKVFYKCSRYSKNELIKRGILKDGIVQSYMEHQKGFFSTTNKPITTLRYAYNNRKRRANILMILHK